MNKKKGGLYKLLYHAVDCTNDRDGLSVIIYESMNQENDAASYIYVREEQEFFKKFERVLTEKDFNIRRLP